MNKKWLILKFKGGKFFPNSDKSKDKIRTRDGIVNRKDIKPLNVPIGTLSVNTVSNVLHVLMGEAPSQVFGKRT